VPEDDPVWAERLHCWALSLAGVTSCVAPGNAELFEMGAAAPARNRYAY
jgi:hypothetical protein